MTENYFHQKRSILSGLLFMLLLGSFLFSPQVKTAMAEDNHSGGFTVHSEKVDGTINVIAMLFGEVDIGEGNIYGLTITKNLPTPQGNLIVNIKSPGPVPISNLSGKTMGGLSLPKGVCSPGKFGYICFEDVTMTLSEQQVDSIDIPNAKIETCYEHECPENKPEEVETLQASDDDEIKRLEELIDDLNGLEEQLKIVEELLQKAKTIETTIRDEKQPQQIKAKIEQLGKKLQDPEALLATAQEINEDYDSFNENATEYGLTSGVVEDILKQIEGQVEEHEQFVTELEEALSVFEAQDGTSEDAEIDEKHLAYLQSLMEQFESEDDMNLTDIQKQLKDIQKEVAAQQSEAQQLEENRQEWNEQLETFYATIQKRSKAISESDNYTDDEREKVVSELDVAEPHKFIEKKIRDLVLQSENPEVSEELEQLETLISDVFEELDSNKLLVQQLEEIADLIEEIETALGREEGAEISTSQFKGIEKKLAALSKLANMPEKLASEYKYLPLEDSEKHSFRLKMQDYIERWQQLPKIFVGDTRNEQLEQTINEFNELKKQIEKLKEHIKENMDELDIDEELMSDNEDNNSETEDGRTLPILDRLIGTPTPLPNEQTSKQKASQEDENDSTSGEEQSSGNESSGSNSSSNGSNGSKSNNNKDKAPPSSSTPSSPSKPPQEKPQPQEDKRKQKQIDDALRQGQQHVDTIRNTVQKADGNLIKIEQTSTDLTRMILGRHAIKVIPSGEFDTNLTRLDRHIRSLDNPVKQLRSSIDRAQQLLGKQARTNHELSELKKALQDVIVLRLRIEKVRKTLDTYPDYVVFVNTKRKNVNNVLKKFDAMLN